MSADYNWILPNLALGSAPPVSAIPQMQADGITAVLDVRSHGTGTPSDDQPALGSDYAGTGITYYNVPMVDDGTQKPVSTYQQTTQIIENVLADPSQKILVHCQAGECRSPSVVYAYLRELGDTSDQAWNAIVAVRPSVANGVVNCGANQQYIPGAEASVPYLPTGPQPTWAQYAGAALGAVAIAGAVGYGFWWWTNGRRY